MGKGYLFISNGTKPSKEAYESCDSFGPGSFSQASIWAANELGWSLHMGLNRKYPNQIKSIGYDIKFYDQHSYRSVFALKDNWIAYKNLCKYLKNNPEIEIIHCNTPIGGLVGRLAGKKFKKKVIYTAHGFHFYKGAPLFNRTILKWVEKWLAHKTDILLTMNEEDYQNAQNMTLKPCGKVFKISGVGIDIERLKSTERDDSIRKSLGLHSSDFVCISLGDLNKNKNFSTVIEAIAKTNSKDIHYLICGKGPLQVKLNSQAKELGIEDQVHFLGFRTDVVELMKGSDCAIISSFREGLPRTTMEAMTAGLPCIVSDIRGNRDLITNQKGGYLVPPTDSMEFAKAILRLKDNPEICSEMGTWNLNRIQDFSIERVQKEMLDVFKHNL